MLFAAAAELFELLSAVSIAGRHRLALHVLPHGLQGIQLLRLSKFAGAGALFGLRPAVLGVDDFARPLAMGQLLSLSVSLLSLHDHDLPDLGP